MKFGLHFAVRSSQTERKVGKLCNISQKANLNLVNVFTTAQVRGESRFERQRPIRANESIVSRRQICESNVVSQEAICLLIFSREPQLDKGVFWSVRCELF